MIKRIFKHPKSRSFFLFGARGTGKSTLLKQLFNLQDRAEILYLDLLDPVTERQLAGRPERLIEMLEAYKQGPEWVIIDEIQKIPYLPRSLWAGKVRMPRFCKKTRLPLGRHGDFTSLKYFSSSTNAVVSRG